MTVRSPPRKSFASRNLNSATRKPEQARPQRAYGGGGRLLVLGKRPEPTAASKTNTVAAPVPMNTPSLRRESGGQDVSVKLVPSGGGGWAQEKQPEPEPEPRRLAPPANKEPPVAPWAKQAVVDAAKPPEDRAPAWSQKPAPEPEPPKPPPPPPPKPDTPPQQHQWRRSQDAERRIEQSVQPPPPPANTSPKSEPPDKLSGESQSDYMKRLAQLRAAKRRAEEQAEEDARRARAAERLARLDAQRRAAHPPAPRPPPVQQQEDDRWQRGARVPAPPVEREPLRDAGVPLERAATRDGRSFASMFSPPSEPNPDQLKVGDGYDRHPNREKPKLFDPKSGSYVDPSSRPPPAPKTRGRGLRVIDDSAAPKKEAPQVRLLARPADAKPAPGTIVQQKKEEKKKLAELPKDLSNADAETVKRLKAERAAEKAARQPRTRGFLYKHENGDVVLADGQPSRRSKRGRGGRKRAEAAAAAAAKAEQERLAPGPPVRSSSAGSVGDRGRAPGPVSQQSPPEPARGLGVFSDQQAPGNLSYAPFGGFSTAPPPPERAAVSALGGAEFIPRTSSAGSFGGIGIVQDDAPPRHDGPSTLGGAEFVPGAGLVRPEAASEQQLSSSFDAAGAPEFVPGGAFGSGLLGAPQKPGQPQGSGLLWDR